MQNNSSAPVNRYRARKHRSVAHFISPSDLADLAFQFSPKVTIHDGHSDNSEFDKMENQVAGHQFSDSKDSVGMLKCKSGTVLKPITKLNVGLREVHFYQRLQTTTDPMLLELRDYAPKFFGTRILTVNEKKTEFIVLENLLEKFYEPCIMDVKIGRQTWDPLATECKITREKEKYKQCKADVAFCIPGFHVYKHSTGKLHKYGKDYGKKLNGTTVIDAFNTFLNGDTNGNVNRELLVQLLSTLWKIQKWARTQTSIRLYSTSLLIIYDYKLLRSFIGSEPGNMQRSSSSLNLTQCKTSFVTPSYTVNSPDSFSGQITSSGPVYKNSTATKVCPIERQQVCDRSVALDSQTAWHKDFHKTRRSHSFHINYNDFLSKIKLDYTSTLEEIQGKKCPTENNWCSIYIIDFAHTFPTEDNTIDNNYVEGIDSIVDIFEKFLYSLK